MENRIKILEPIIVLVTCADVSLIRYTDYYYCGNGLLCYFNSDYHKVPKTINVYECMGKMPSKYGSSYYIPYKYIDKEVKGLALFKGYTLDDFRADKVIDDDTFETSHLSKEGFPWFDVLKQQAEKYLKNN